MIRILVLILFMMCSVSVSATEQIDDVFSVGGKAYPIDELPLDQLLAPDHISKMLQQPVCTASWRGYQANWYLKDDYLWLESIRKNPCDSKYEYIESSILFGNKNYPIKAEWFTGNISFPVGEIKYRYGKDGDGPHGYDVDVFVFTFNHGKLVSKNMQVYSRSYQ